MSSDGRRLHGRRGDGGRGRPAAATTARSASSASACPASPPTSPGGPTRPDACSIYESGTIGAKPAELPLSIGDGELAETADAVVSVPEMFAYWLQGRRIDVAFLGAAQIDRHGNLNSTVVGDYATPKVRLPGGGGAPEIALGVDDVFVHAPALAARVRRAPRLHDEPRRQRPRGDHRPRVSSSGRDGELTLVAVHPGVAVEDVVAGDGLGPAGRGRRPRDRPAHRRRAHRPASTANERTCRCHRLTWKRPSSCRTTRASGPRSRSTIPGTARPAGARPARPLVSLPEELHALEGPVFGDETVGELDHDLTRQHEGEPLGERIIVTGRVLDEDGRPVRGRARRGLAGERRRPLPPRRRPAPGAARPELLRAPAAA